MLQSLWKMMSRLLLRLIMHPPRDRASPQPAVYLKERNILYTSVLSSFTGNHQNLETPQPNVHEQMTGYPNCSVSLQWNAARRNEPLPQATT